jgi:hypothetical protein
MDASIAFHFLALVLLLTADTRSRFIYSPLLPISSSESESLTFYSDAIDSLSSLIALKCDCAGGCAPFVILFTVETKLDSS